MECEIRERRNLRCILVLFQRKRGSRVAQQRHPLPVGSTIRHYFTNDTNDNNVRVVVFPRCRNNTKNGKPWRARKTLLVVKASMNLALRLHVLQTLTSMYVTGRSAFVTIPAERAPTGLGSERDVCWLLIAAKA